MIRIANNSDFEQINIIRKQVSKIHSDNEDKIFKNDFSNEFRDYLLEYFGSDEKVAIVCEIEKQIVGYVMLDFIVKPETVYSYEQKFVNICEFGVLEDYRSKGIGKQLLEFVINFAKEKHFDEIRLDAWNFNNGAVEFYKRNGFENYRSYFRMFLK